MINKSLSALGNVIKALTESKTHIPYVRATRESHCGPASRARLLCLTRSPLSDHSVTPS